MGLTQEQVAKGTDLSIEDIERDLFKQQNFRMWFKNGLKAQKLLAQGSALGIIAISKAPCKGDKFASIISSCITLLSSNSSCSAKHLK